MRHLYILLFINFLLFSCQNQSSSSDSSSSSSYSPPKPSCTLTTSKARSMVRQNWASIQRKASFKVSDKGDFEVTDWRKEGNELEVDIFSRGFMYDISFTVSLDYEVESDCSFEGAVLDVYNYSR